MTGKVFIVCCVLLALFTLLLGNAPAQLRPPDLASSGPFLCVRWNTLDGPGPGGAWELIKLNWIQGYGEGAAIAVAKSYAYAGNGTAPQKAEQQFEALFPARLTLSDIEGELDIHCQQHPIDTVAAQMSVIAKEAAKP